MNDSDRAVLVPLIRALKEEDSDKPATARDLGQLGRLFGASYANTNITGIAIIAMVMLLFVVVMLKPEHPGSRELITGAFSIISLALGYLFGSRRRA